jgi:phenylalanyl-tRNA synthetase beta chain
VKVVSSWLREFAPTDMDPEELAELMTRRGVKVEEVLRPWDGLAGVTVARVLEVTDHPNSEKLCVARVDDGTGEQVVCAGVRNFTAGDLVPWAKPGSRVPALPEPLAPRTLRGVVSNGMLCSPRELNIADSHLGILLLDPSEGFVVGEDVKEVVGLDDVVFDIEVEPNRPDFLSVFGVAREVAAATGVPLLSPDLSLEETDEAAESVARVRSEAPEGCPEYLARVIRGVDAGGRSPLRVQARLTASGMRPVSNVVDATNYAMLELGQPLHAFDLDTLAGPEIVVRYAEEGERLITLDDVERSLVAGDLLICDRDRPVALAGVMGGATSEVSEGTSDILLESAYFTRTGVLRTARRLDLHSEASHRFERGTDPEGLERCAVRGAKLIAAWAGGSVARGVTRAGRPPARHRVAMRPSRASRLLAYDVAPEDAAAVFDSLGMTHRAVGEALEVEVPGYRVDIDREVDLIEEVARVEGYDKIGTHVASAGQAGGVPPGYAFRGRVRDALVRGGLQEARLLSFASEGDLAFTPAVAPVVIANPLQADEGFLRTALLPGLLHAAARNHARGVERIALFEVGTVFNLEGDRVVEDQEVAFVLAGTARRSWDSPERPVDVLDAKGLFENLCDELRVRVWSLGEVPDERWHPGRSAEILVEGAVAGALGEIHPRLAEAEDLPGRVAAGWVRIEAMQDAAVQEMVAHDVPRFPPVRRDLAFVVSERVSSGAVQAAIEDVAGSLLGSCLLFDVFRGGSLPEGTKSLAFALDLRAEDRTLTREETDPVVAKIVDRVTHGFDAKLRA